jgi:hypothetical protein
MHAEGKFQVNHFSKEAIKPGTILQKKGTLTATAAGLYAAGVLSLEVNVYHDPDCPAADAPSSTTNPHLTEGFFCTCHPDVELNISEMGGTAKKAA